MISLGLYVGTEVLHPAIRDGEEESEYDEGQG